MSLIPSLVTAKDMEIDASKRSIVGLLGVAMTVASCRSAPAARFTIEGELAQQYVLLRRAYQANDAELLRQFYSSDVVVATEGAAPVVGIDAVVSAARLILPKRRDIGLEVLRLIHSARGDSVTHFAKLTAYPRDPTQSPRSASAVLTWNFGPGGWRCVAEIILLQDMTAIANLPSR